MAGAMAGMTGKTGMGGAFAGPFLTGIRQRGDYAIVCDPEWAPSEQPPFNEQTASEGRRLP
jgi:hypothetical protein